MMDREARMAECIRLVADNLENLNLNDRDAWRQPAEQLADILRQVPPESTEVRRLIQSVIQGLERMAQDPVQDLVAAVDAMAGALQAAESFIRGDSGKEDVNKACDRMTAIAETRSSAPVLKEPPPATIDDAAAILVRLEPGEYLEWKQLETLLLQLAAAANGDQDARRRLLHDAAVHAAELAGAAAADPGGAIAAIGSLLDEAMNLSDGSLDPTRAPAATRPPVPAAAPAAEGDPADFMPADNDVDLVSEFITESIDLIQNAEEALLSLENDPDDTEAVGKVFRAFHTVKGTSGFLDLTLISELGHHAETLLSRVRDGEIRYSGGYADLSLQALDTIKNLVAAVQRALAGEPLRKPQGYDDLLAVLKNPEAAGVSEGRGAIEPPRVGDILVATGKVDREQIREAMDAHPDAKLGEALVRTQAVKLADVSQALRTQSSMRNAHQVVDASVRVSTQRLDRLIDMVGELVIAHSMVAQDAMVGGSENHGLVKKVSHTTKIVRELQDISMSMRMVPLKASFSKMARLVRDVARKLGKNVNFLTDGEDTEIDRNLVDIINDPLVHMVRNAVDHGVESPEERRAAGKPEQGSVKISAFHSAGSVVVEISDDGKGVDREVVIAKAKERGLISDAPDFNDRGLSDREVFNLLFEPGFSTAKVVTDVSGRGVGMDVVKRNIESLRGTVEIRSEKGKGSVFRMSLPLTLAIIDGMVIRVAQETYVIPTISIIRSVKPSVQDVTSVFQRGEMLLLQGNLVPLYRLSRIYNLSGAKEELKDAIVVVVEDEDRRAGLVIDELIGRQQVVIKSLGETMTNLPGISGGAIMPTGRVGLILDIAGLLRLANPERREGYREEFGGARSQSLAA